MARIIAVFSISLVFSNAALGKYGAPITARDLVSLRDIGGHARGAISVSPNGLWVAFQLQSPNVSQGSYELTWITVSATTVGKPIHVANGGDVILNPSRRSITNGNRPETRARWSPDSKMFAYLVRRNSQTQIWLSRPNRTGQTQLTHNSADVMDFAWSTDGSKLFFETSSVRKKTLKALDEEGVRGFLFDTRFRPTVSQKPIQRICDVVEHAIQAVELGRSCKPRLWVYDFKSRSERLATKKEIATYRFLRQSPATPTNLERRSIQSLRQWRMSDRYVWLENLAPQVYEGSYAPLTPHALIAGSIYRCTADACRAYGIRGHQDFWWREGGEEVIFLRRDGGSHSQTGLYAWAPLTGSLRRILQTDDWLSDCAPAGDRLICLYETWTEPRKIVSVPLEEGSITTLYDPNPELTRRPFSRIEKLEWEDAFGNPTHGHLVYPIKYSPERKYPLVIVTYQSHGFLRGGVGDEYPIHPLAAEGFFVLSHEMPLDLELVAKKANPNAALQVDQYIRKSVLSSQKKIVHKLADQGLVDPNRIAITGLSEGSSQVTYGLIHSDLFSTAISSTGVRKSSSHYYLFGEKTREFWRWILNGSPDDPNSGWRHLSVGLNLDRVYAPLLINISDEELLGTLEDYARMLDANKPVEMYVFPGEHHIKWRPNHRLAIYLRNIQWLKFWLMGEEEDDPVSPGQYARWRKMRSERCTWDEPEDERPSYCEYSNAVH